MKQPPRLRNKTLITPKHQSPLPPSPAIRNHYLRLCGGHTYLLPTICATVWIRYIMFELYTNRIVPHVFFYVWHLSFSIVCDRVIYLVAN